VGISVNAITITSSPSSVSCAEVMLLACACSVHLCVGCGGWEVGEEDVHGVNDRSVQWLTKNTRSSATA